MLLIQGINMHNPLFPTGIAEGNAFLGRQEEMFRLLDNIEQGRHTLLLSPRRYGKTSLAKQAIKKSKLPFVEIDLFLAIDENAIETCIIQGVESLIANLSHEPTQWMKTLINYFKKANKKWTIGIKGVKLELTPDNHEDIADNILSLLQALEHLLANKKQKAIIFIDEFQEINKLQTSKVIEGAIRHFAQYAKYTLFIFSGSSRHILVDMFGNSENPLYNLCDWLTLERLPAALYQKYLNKVAKQTWQQPLNQTVFQRIIEYSQCHPETIYALCARLWQHSGFRKKSPTENDIKTVWQKFIKDKLKQTRSTLSHLSTGQLKILILIAMNFDKPISGKEAQNKINLTSPSIIKAIKALEKQDIIEKLDNGRYRIIHPVVAATLKDYYAGY